jgi:hypothetical protein
MMIIGIGDSDADAGADADTGVHADSDVAFQVISIQGIIGFFMMLGWVGLALNRSAGYGTAVSVGVGCGAGIAMNFAVAKVFQWFRRMQSSGTMDLSKAVGQEGSVYLGIKGGGTGQVQVAVQEHLKIFDAVSEDGADLPTGTLVVVVRVVNGNTMVVRKS